MPVHPTIDTDWVEAWLQAAAPDEPQKLQRRLDWDGWSAEAFRAWLDSEPAEQAAAAAEGAAALDHARSLIKAAWDAPLLPYGSDPFLPFVDLWWPLRCQLADDLRRQVWFQPTAAAETAAVNGAVANQLADALLERLCALTDQVLWELFSSGRGPGVMLLAHLGAAGDGSGPPLREHYEAFIRQHRRDGLGSLLDTFPVLQRLIGTVLALWTANSTEMLARISADRPALETRFSIPRRLPLVAVRQGLSDPHRGGRAVAVLEFADATTDFEPLRVVYKPKDMGVDAAYQALLADLNAHSDLPPLRCLAVHRGEGYGYMEYVPHQLCADGQELQRFYDHAGRLTAVLHLLGCTDCHHENLIACADQLLLIDTETLLEGDLPDHVQEAKTAQTASRGLSQLQERCRGSVLRSGLMPQWMFLGAAKRAVDISALGITPPAAPEQQAAGWLGLNSDGMMPGRMPRSVSVPTSLPVGFGAANPLDQHLEVFCAGFSRQMRALEQLRSRWLAPGSVLEGFAGLPRRIVLRATRVYFAIQRQQLEPAALRSALAQALKLEQLARSFLLAERRPLHWPLLAAERQQMQRLDIPFFTHAIDGDAIDLDADGGRLPGFIQTSGLEAARRRLRQLDAQECAFQLQLIRGACQARQLRTEQVAAESRAAAESPSLVEPGPSSASLGAEDARDGREAATAVAHQLLAMAIRDPQGQVEWLGMDLGGDGESFAFGPVGLSLYGGSIGFACLLQQLRAAAVQLPEAETVPAAILAPLDDLIGDDQAEARHRWWRDQPLGLSGCGGILLGLLALNRTDRFDALLAGLLPRVLEADQQRDLIGGCCGLIGALLQRGTAAALAMAVRAGDHLLAQQQEQGGWAVAPRQPALLGFSHGTAGMAAALARLHAVSGETRFGDAAAAALAYERSHFQPDQGNWPDFRQGTDQEPPSFMVSWCHGAPGIALGRACLWGTSLWDERCSEEIGIALATTAALPSPGMDHLCCGSLGLMLILQQLASGPWSIAAEQRDQALAQAAWYRQQALDRCAGGQVRLRCFGTQEGSLMLPGFFTGLSGMGLALLETPASQSMVMTLLSGGLFDRRGQ